MFPCMKLRHIEELLQGIDGFLHPKVLLEQYETPAHLGSHMLHTIQSHYNDLEGKFIADLGSGCGGLSIGACLMEAAFVIGFEIDAEAIDVLQVNADEQEVFLDVVQCDVVTGINERWCGVFDTVIMNPPFGTKKNAGIDMKFLEQALKLTKNSVYSLHKTSTRDHVLKVAKSLGAVGEVLAELRYDLPSTYKFHKKNSVDVHVDFIRFCIESDVK